MAMWKKDKDYAARGFLTPPPKWCGSIRQLPIMLPRSMKKLPSVPLPDSPYGYAKHVQLVEKDPRRSIALFWAALNAGDRVDSALKDMAITMKQVDRTDEAIEAIKSFRYLCSLEAQDPLDNIMIELYKRSGRTEEQIEVLQARIKNIEEVLASGGRRVKTVTSNGKKIQITIIQEYARLLGNLAWVYLQQDKYALAEELYRKALSLEEDKAQQCNLAICLMYMNKMTEAKIFLECAKSGNRLMRGRFAKSIERANQILLELESQGCEERRQPFSSFIRRERDEDLSKDQTLGLLVSNKTEDGQNQETVHMDEHISCFWNDSNISSSDIESSKGASFVPRIGFHSSDTTSFADKLNKGEFFDEDYNEITGFSSKWDVYEEKVAGGGTSYDGYMKGYVSPDPAAGSATVPLTQPRRGSPLSFHNAPGGYIKKLSFADIGVQPGNFGLGQASCGEVYVNDRRYLEELQGQCKPNSSDEEVIKHFSFGLSDNGWTDKGAKEDIMLPRDDYFDENTNCNILYGSPGILNQTEILGQKMKSLHIRDGYYSQSGNSYTSMFNK